MAANSGGPTKDISVLQLLTRLVQETDKIIRLADDIDQHATTPQAKSALNLIGSEINNILQILKASLDPLYKLYELDSGMRTAEKMQQDCSADEASSVLGSNEYDESALWAELKSKAQMTRSSLDSE